MLPPTLYLFLYVWDMLLGRETCRIITLHEHYVDKRMVFFHMHEDKKKNRRHLYIFLLTISLNNDIKELVLEAALISVFIAWGVTHDYESEKIYALFTEILYLYFTVFHWKNFLLIIQYHQYMIRICFQPFFNFCDGIELYFFS